VLLVKQELLNLPGHLESPSIFSEVHVAQSLAFCVVLCRSLFVPSSISSKFSLWLDVLLHETRAQMYLMTFRSHLVTYCDMGQRETNSKASILEIFI